MSRADELQVCHVVAGADPDDAEAGFVPVELCERYKAAAIIRELESKIAEQAERIRELERERDEARDACEKFRQALVKTIHERDSARAEVPEWLFGILEILVDQRDDCHAEATDLLSGVTDDQLRACGIEVP